MSPPRLREVALFTRDVAALAAFYEHVLGIEPEERSPTPTAAWSS